MPVSTQTLKLTASFSSKKTEELIRHPIWQDNPSIGYLNAFDVLAYTKATESTYLLSKMVQNKERRDLAHASFLTLNRLTRSSPTETLSQLIEDEELVSKRGTMLGNMVANADLRDLAQQQLVKRYLLDIRRTEDELRAFSGVFPNRNIFVSNNLLTNVPRANPKDHYERKRASLKLVNNWLNEPQFQSIRPHLLSMRSRLE